MRGHRDLRAARGLTLLCALLAPLLPVEALSLLFLLPLAFFLPGYALSAAIFAQRPLEWPQRLMLSLGLSLSVLALGAVVLNYVPGGVGPVAWALLLALVTLLACRVAARRRPGASAPDRTWPRPHLSVAGVGLMLGALLSVVAALVLTFTTTSAKHADGYTEMWLLPPASKNAPAGGARVGVTSQEQAPTSYRMVVRIGGRPEDLVREFSLDPGETRVAGLRPEPGLSPGGAIPVSAILFTQSDPSDVYRRVSGWMAAPRGSR